METICLQFFCSSLLLWQSIERFQRITDNINHTLHFDIVTALARWPLLPMLDTLGGYIGSIDTLEQWEKRVSKSSFPFSCFFFCSGLSACSTFALKSVPNLICIPFVLSSFTFFPERKIRLRKVKLAYLPFWGWCDSGVLVEKEFGEGSF